MTDEPVTRRIELPEGELSVLQPSESAELPQDRESEWTKEVPFWSMLWKSSVALAEQLSEMPLGGLRLVELGCGLGAPSLAAAGAGAEVIATDAEPAAIELVARSAELNAVALETLVVDWSEPDALLARGPFDLVIGSDLLYERQFVARLLELLPKLASEALIADPGRPASAAFLERADERWDLRSARRGAISIHSVRFRD